MPRNAFVEPATVKLELSEGDWIEIKKELSYGELLQLQDSTSSFGEDDKRHLDIADFYVNQIVMWVVAWSFEDGAGPVEVSVGSVKALKGPIASEINTALTKYITELDSKNSPMPVSTE